VIIHNLTCIAPVSTKRPVAGRKELVISDGKYVSFNPLAPTVVIWVLKHPVPDRVKPSFVIFDIQAL